MSNPDIK